MTVDNYNRGIQGFRRHWLRGCKHIGASARPAPFPILFPIRSGKITFAQFVEFLQVLKNRSILQVVINFWVFSDVCTGFHPNQRPGSVKIWRVCWDVLRTVYYSLVLFTCQRIYENIWLLRDLTPEMDEIFAEH